MWKQIMLLTKLQSCNLGGLNQLKYGKDKKQKNRLILLAVTYLILGIFLAFYSGAVAYGCVLMGMADIVPAYVLAVVSLLILFFTMFKAGSILFNMNTYEMMISLPVSPAAIVISRFFSMYLQNVVLGMVVMIPSAVVAGIMTNAGIGYYLLMLVGTLLMPFLPMTIATAAGAVITAISSRMKHKNLVTIILTIGLTVGILVLSFALPGSSGMYDGSLIITQDMLQELGTIAKEQIYGIYPPARLFTAGVVEGSLSAFLEFAVLSLGCFLVLAALVQWKFVSICSALYARSAGKNYQMQELSQSRPLIALYQKEMKRYFASSIYVLNTMIGYLLMVVFAVALFVTGVDEMEGILQMPGIVTKAVPLVMALMCSFTSTTVSSISMEGKQWWIARSLPFSTRQLLDSKIMVNLTIALSCYLLSEVFLFLALKVSFLEGVWMLLVPLVYIFFMSVAGLTINCKMPVFQWESETVAVKQGGALFVAILVGFASVLVPMILVLFVSGIAVHLVMCITVVVIGGATWFLYLKNNLIDLRTIG